MPRPLIEEVKIRFDGRPDPFTCELVMEDDRGVIVEWRNDSPFVAGDYRLPAGAVTTAFYWRGRRHNLYEPVAPDGDVVCHRIDIIEPPLIEPGRLTFRDMLLDILIPPGGEPRLQDEDELQDAVARGLIDEAEAAELLAYATSVRDRAHEIIAEAHDWLNESGA